MWSQQGFLFLDWITQDFLKKIEDRPDLLKKLADPRYSQALNEFTSNPQEAWKRVSGNKELESFIKDLCGLLGEHFTTMAEQIDQSVCKDSRYGIN